MNTASDPGAIDDPTNWHGGFYELAIDLGPRDDTRLEKALVNLWRAAGATGPFAVSAGGACRSVDLSLASLHEHAHLRGVVQAPLFGSVVAGMAAIEFDSGDELLAFYLPMAALSRADARVGGYPFGGFAKPEWRVPVDAWVASIGAQSSRSSDSAVPRSVWNQAAWTPSLTAISSRTGIRWPTSQAGLRPVREICEH
jgi:hypothetical protein